MDGWLEWSEWRGHAARWDAGFLTIRGNGSDGLPLGIAGRNAASSFRKRRSNTVSSVAARSVAQSPRPLFLLIFNGDQGHIANLQAAAWLSAVLSCVEAPMSGHF